MRLPVFGASSQLYPLYDYLCERNAVIGNPADGVKRPPAHSGRDCTPSLGDAQARRLLEAPPPDTLKGIRDRAILATLLYHGLRREELCLLKVNDMQTHQGVMHFKVTGKRSKVRYIPLHPLVHGLFRNILRNSRNMVGRWVKTETSPFPSRK